MSTPFETEPCTRCGGTGRYSFNGEHDRCYKCDAKNGSRSLTQRGAAAREYYLAQFQLRAADVRVGDVIRTDKIRQLTVTAVAIVPSRARFMRDGEWIDAPDQVRIDGPKASIKLDLDSVVRRLPTAEEKESAVADALAYQSTLTKTGKPRKR